MAKKKSDTGYRIIVSGVRNLVGILLLMLVLLLIFILGRTAYRFGYAVFNQTAMAPLPGENITVTIPAGASPREIGQILENAGLVGDASLFAAQERLSVYHKKITADDFAGGTYRLNTSQKPDDILAVLAGEAEGLQTDDGSAPAAGS